MKFEDEEEEVLEEEEEEKIEGQERKKEQDNYRLSRYQTAVSRRVAQMPDSALPDYLRFADKGYRDYHKTIIAIEQLEKEGVV